MKILVCNPNTNLPVRNQLGVLSNTVAICPPLGIGYVAAALRAAGHEVRLYDFFGSSEAEIEGAIRADAPDVIGVSCFTEQRGAALQVARIAKRVCPSTHVMMGGSHASFYPEQMLAHYPELDSIVQFEAEAAVVEWMRRVQEKRRDAEPSAGVAARGPAGIVLSPPLPFLADLDALAYPVRDLANRPPYRPYPAGYTPGRQFSMMATRGCPYRCQFCSTTRYWGSKYRTRSVAGVVGEIEHLVRERGAEYIQFFDDALTARKAWFLELCAAIAQRGLAFDWEAITRVNYVDEEICRAMRRAGCRTVIFGVESFSNTILKSIHKGVTGEQAVAALQTARRCGLNVTCLLMVGNPGETWDTVRDTMAGIRATRPRNMDVTITAVFPRTELYDIASRAGLINDEYWLDESRAAPLFTVEHSVERLREFKAALHDAHWSCNRSVRLFRALGLRQVKRWLTRGGEGAAKEPAHG